MKKIYEAPTANVITLEAVEKLALLEDRSSDGLTRAGDIIDASTTTGSGRPK